MTGVVKVTGVFVRSIFHEFGFLGAQLGSALKKKLDLSQCSDICEDSYYNVYGG
jgi:hypothetical protein